MAARRTVFTRPIINQRLQIPRSNIHRNTNPQAPNHRLLASAGAWILLFGTFPELEAWSLELVDWIFSGAWMLEFGCFNRTFCVRRVYIFCLRNCEVRCHIDSRRCPLEGRTPGGARARLKREQPPKRALMEPEAASAEPSECGTIEELFAALESPLLSYALRLTGDACVAEDMV